VAGAIGPDGASGAGARFARGLGYHAVLLSLAAWKGAGDGEILAHCEAAAAEMPLSASISSRRWAACRFGSLWRRFAAIGNVAQLERFHAGVRTAMS
jgi:hypothetical protein